MTPDQITQALAGLDGWAAEGAAITRRWRTRDFAQALALANAIGALAEAMNHHPDLSLGWGWCAARLTSHDVGGLSERDFAAAAQIDEIVKRRYSELS